MDIERILNPRTGAVIREVPDSTEGEIDAALTAATDAFDGWARAIPAERARKLLKLADLIEADAELVAGYFTEYGGTPFVAYLFAEYANMIVVSAMAVTIFFGGWLLPFGIHPPGWVDPFVVLGKILIVFTFFIWVRATLPRLRYDQLMSFGWKILLPLATLNLLVTAIVVAT